MLRRAGRRARRSRLRRRRRSAAAHRVALVTPRRRAPTDIAVVRVTDAFDALRSPRARRARRAARRHRRRRHRFGGQDGHQGPRRRRARAASSRCTRARARTTTRPACPSPCSPPDPRTEALVLEMGARAHGDIAALCAIARPDRRRDHQHRPRARRAPRGPRRRGPGEGRAARGARRRTARPCSTPAIPATPGLAARTDARVLLVSVGRALAADVRAVDVELDAELRPRFRLESPWGGGPVELAVRGAHNVVERHARRRGRAGARAWRSTTSPPASPRCEPAPWRMEVARTADGVRRARRRLQRQPVVDGRRARGARPGRRAPGRRLAVLGEMRELGELSEPEHAARRRRSSAPTAVDALVAVGPEAAPLADRGARRGCRGHRGARRRRRARRRRGASSRRGDAVLVKGSRAVGLELVATALRGSARDRRRRDAR